MWLVITVNIVTYITLFTLYIMECDLFHKYKPSLYYGIRKNLIEYKTHAEKLRPVDTTNFLDRDW